MRQSTKSLPGSSHLTILISQMGGLGDLVLTAGFLSSLRDSFPDASLVLVCRTVFAPVCELFPKPPDEVIALNFNPYDWAIPSGELFAAVEPVLEQAAGVQPDLFISAEFQPTWFTWLLAAHRKPRRGVQATLARRPGSVLTGTLEHFDLDPVEFEGPKLDNDLHEIQRYAELVKYLGGATNAATPWALTDSIESQVQTLLQQMNLRSGEYLTCFPLGAAGTGVKRWPKDSYLRALTSIRQKSPLPVLFTGGEDEALELRSFAEALGGEDVHVYTGPPESIPILGGLLLHSRAYLGNDTGPVHLASAFGVGGVALHGGGHWPAYGAWGPGSVAMVHPLPCFGCSWDCLFGHGVCVESIRVEPVVEAVLRVLTGESVKPETVLLAELPSQTLDLIRDANRRYREAELDRGERLSSIIELRRNVDSSHGRLEQLEHTAAGRLRALEAQHTAIEQLRHESEHRIAELQEISSQRLVALESQSTSYLELKREADIRSAHLVELTDRLAKQDHRLRELEEIAIERFKALQARSRLYEELSVEAERRTAGLIELTAHIAARDESIRKITEIAEDLMEALEAQDAAYKRLEIEAEKRNAGLDELTAAIGARDSQVSIWVRTAEERLIALQQAGVAMRSLSEEAEKQRRISDERLVALLATDDALRAVRADSELRLRGLEELTAAIAARDARIEVLEKTAADRLEALLNTDAALQAEQMHVKELLNQIQQMEKQAVASGKNSPLPHRVPGSESR